MLSYKIICLVIHYPSLTDIQSHLVLYQTQQPQDSPVDPILV